MVTTNGSAEWLCARGWHTQETEDRVLFVRWGTRLRDGNGEGTIVYRIGPAPFESAMTTIWCYGDHGRPWKCSTCRRPILRPEVPAGGKGLPA